jgi:hypothetical protein
VCGASEGSLTSDCPGKLVDPERQREVFETKLDYTEARGWHLASRTREPKIEDPQPGVALSIDPRAGEHATHLGRELMLKAIAWVLADRICEERSSALTLLEDVAGPLLRPPFRDLSIAELKQLEQLKQAKIDFQSTSQEEDRCNDEFRQTARKLVDTLEKETAKIQEREAAGLCLRCGSEDGNSCICYAR